MRGSVFCCALGVLLAVQSPVALAGQAEFEESNILRRQAIEALQGGDAETAIANFQKILELRPNHPGSLFNLAYSQMIAEQPNTAIDSLRRYLELGLTANLTAEGPFAALSEVEGFGALSEVNDQNAEPVTNSKPFLRLDQKIRISEGLARDPVSGGLFVSSVGERQVYRVGEGGELDHFAGGPDTPIMAAMGMAVDEGRGLLWLASAALPAAEGIGEGYSPASAVFAIDLASGAIVHQFPLDDGGEHVLGDLIVTGDGLVLATDSVGPNIYRTLPGGEMELWLTSDEFVSLQGLALSGDGRTLYVADYAMGIHMIDMESKEVRTLVPPPNVTLLGVDGLYYYHDDSVAQNYLIAVQNGVRPHRILQIRLGDLYGAITDVEVLEANNPAFDEPTLGMIDDGKFYFTANSHWPIFGGGEPDEAALKRWREPEILVIDLLGDWE